MNDCIPENLARFFDANPHIALAFSGGVDSSYLLAAAVKYGAEVGAYTIESPFRSPVERANAEKVAEMLGVTPTIIETDPLSDPALRSNTPDRCYLCKKMIFSTLVSAASADGFRTVCDASNASDSPLERPGMKALDELGVRSPLREAGLRKEDVRRLSRDMGLGCWNTPSDSCLATRILTGTAITEELLNRTAESESRLRAMGFSGIRVRVTGDGSAVLEIPESQIPTLNIHMSEVDRLLNNRYGSYSVKERTLT